jgi:hypothetical protein
MSEPLLSGDGPTPDPALVCPWCSAPLSSSTVDRCPSCGAALHEGDASEVPGVTRVDVEAILKGRGSVQKPRGLIGWLSGEYEATEAAPPPGTLEPPDDAVRREMIRLELAALEAEVLARQAEAVADAATESGRPVVIPEPPVGEAADAAEASTDAAGPTAEEPRADDAATNDDATNDDATDDDATTDRDAADTPAADVAADTAAAPPGAADEQANPG